MQSTPLHTILTAALLGVLLLSGCDRHVDDGHFSTVDRVEVRDHENGTLLAFYQRGEAGDQFQGPGIPTLAVGAEIELDIHFFDGDGNRAPLGPGQEFQLGLRLAELEPDGVEGQPGIVTFEVDGDHIEVQGAAPGETHLVLRLMHEGHSDFDSPPLRFQVGDGAGFGDVHRVEVRDHDDNGALLAFYQRGEANDQFQGPGIPPLDVSDEIELDIYFFNAEGVQAGLGAGQPFQLGARLAEEDLDGVEGQPGVVTYEIDDEQIEVEGEASGETHLVLQLVHQGEADFDSPPLRFTVRD